MLVKLCPSGRLKQQWLQHQIWKLFLLHSILWRFWAKSAEGSKCWGMQRSYRLNLTQTGTSTSRKNTGDNSGLLLDIWFLSYKGNKDFLHLLQRKKTPSMQLDQEQKVQRMTTIIWKQMMYSFHKFTLRGRIGMWFKQD